jgi:predicted DNA-binding protein YlxM (UPF0122 family)
MAISKQQWQQAQAMFEAGASLSEIAGKVDIERSTISKKAKKEEWDKAINQQLILDDIRLQQRKATLNEQQLQHHDYTVNFKLMMMDDIERFSNASMKKANDLMTNTETGGDFKAIIDGVDRLSILAKINDRHAPPASIQQNTQNNTEKQITRVFHVVE